MSLEKTKEVYETILKIVKENKELLNIDLLRLENDFNNHLFGLELKEIYGLDIDPKKITDTKYSILEKNVFLTFIDGIHSTISWEDNGNQPNREYLITFSYPVGAYIFGNDYPTELFNKFFLELKTYKPDYIDTVNHCLYFKLKNAKNIFNNYNKILKKYYGLNQKDAKQRRIKDLEKEIQELKNK